MSGFVCGADAGLSMIAQRYPQRYGISSSDKRKLPERGALLAAEIYYTQRWQVAVVGLQLGLATPGFAVTNVPDPSPDAQALGLKVGSATLVRDEAT